MIKRITFASRRADLTRASFASVWPEAVAGCSEAPVDVRPARVTVATSLAQLNPGDATYDGVVNAWFTDDEHLARFDAWLGTAHGRSVRGRILQIIDAPASPEVVVDEVVLRGEDWLEQRWRDGSDQLKHLALAQRAEGLTAADFAERWEAHAGQISRPGTSAATAIPDELRGCAYVQNHPRPLASDESDESADAVESAYDAVNEVYFDDFEGLRSRIDWFEANEVGVSGDELFGPSTFLAVREVVVLPAPTPV